MLEQLGKHGGFDLAHRGARATSTSTCTTPSKTSASCSAPRSRRRSATRRGVRRFANALVPLDEALVQVALDLSGRPFLVYDVDPVVGVDRHVRPAARRGVLAGLRRRRRRSRCTSGRCPGKNGHHVIEASFKGVARALRDAVRIEGTSVPSTKGTL